MKEETTVFTARKNEVATQLMKNVYWWMTGALAITALTAMLVTRNEALIQTLFSSSGPIIGLCVAEILLVIVLSAAINRLSAVGATLMFLLYSVLNGITLSAILLIYTRESVVATFFIAAGMFAGMALFGTFTKRDLSGIGRFLIMALIGLIIAMVVNIFLANSRMAWMISIIGVLVFAGLTAWDAQKIQTILANADDINEGTQKIALIGALTLYLDFINLFIHLLSLFGNKR